MSLEATIQRSYFSFRTDTFNVHPRVFPAASECRLTHFLTSCALFRVANRQRNSLYG